MFFRVFFFFKQKTAYEMRISDWSSDVCSSDLSCQQASAAEESSDAQDRPAVSACRVGPAGADARPCSELQRQCRRQCHSPRKRLCRRPGEHPAIQLANRRGQRRHAATRSEEHTSELQSLMRISYAVFCLKKKTIHQIHFYIKFF